MSIAPAVSSALSTASDELIRVRGARVHNLQNVQLDIPRNQFVVVTGPSGSGKSSLAFDTIFAEGQRQFIESLSVNSRQYFDQLERPDVDLVDGLQPTICINQHPGNQNPRSTVATVVEIYDFLRVLMARLGQAHCPRCGEPIRQHSLSQIEERLRGFPEGTKLMLLAPMVRGQRGDHSEVLLQIRKAGLLRVRVNGEVYEIDQVPELPPRKVHTIDAVVDRLVVRTSLQSRLVESLQVALKHGAGLVVASYLEENGGSRGPWRDELFGTIYACPHCQVHIDEVEPRTFSFNSPYGACPECDGLGCREEFDPELVVPNRELSLEDGAVAPWKGLTAGGEKKVKAECQRFLSGHHVSWSTPLTTLSEAVFQKFLYGEDKYKFAGVLNALEKELATALNDSRREFLTQFRGAVFCRDCGGSRLRPEANHVRLAEKNIYEITRLTIGDAARFFQEVKFLERERAIGDPLVREIRKRLEFLSKVGVAYLTLDRKADTLSGGELQRVRLATSIGSGLVGVCYVLDEPSIGLHPRDNQRLIDALRDLQQQGNTVLVVEHDEAMMRQADWLIDVGPGAGRHGGQIVSVGRPEIVAADPASPTGRYLSGQAPIPIPAKRRKVVKSRSLQLEGASANNLKNVSVEFPLGCLVCISGVSGSGKSTLINETLAYGLVRRLGGLAPKPGSFTSLRGVSQIDKIINVDQSPIGRTPRSNPATYTGAFDEIRTVFASTRDAKQRGFRASRFSFNAKGGRCEECQGHGMKKIEMSFLPDLFVTCNACGGARFNRATLAVRYRGQSIADVLNMPVEIATSFFENFDSIHRVLRSLADVGLGYLPLGQASTTLSGGEAQRVKLATELAGADTGKTVYLLDEPTTGLHFEDIRRLLDVLQRLVDRGNTVIVIEHNLDVIKSSDWIIDLGPEGGSQGGYVVAKGTPEEIAQLTDNHTGRFLREAMGGG